MEIDNLLSLKLRWNFLEGHFGFQSAFDTNSEVEGYEDSGRDLNANPFQSILRLGWSFPWVRLCYPDHIYNSLKSHIMTSVHTKS